jgi:hypothetical protein
MEKIQVYVHAENVREPKLIEVHEKATSEELIIIYQQEYPDTGTLEEIVLFFEDEEEPRFKGHPDEHKGPGKRSHIHFHRCKKIEVTVFYNGEDKIFQYSPATTIKKIKSKAIHSFGIKESDAGDYLIKLEDGTVLQAADHIGSFVGSPRCHIKLFLTATKPVQG